MPDKTFQISDLHDKITPNDNLDPDSNYYNENLETKCFSPSEFKSFSKNNNDFSILNLNIRSMEKNFENFKDLLQRLNFKFHVICLTETWQKGDKMNISKLNIPRTAENRRGGGVCVFIQKSITYKRLQNLNVNNTDCESMCVEIINKNSKNLILNVMYRPPSGKFKQFKNHLKEFLNNISRSNKLCYIVGDFNLNLFDYSSNNKIKIFINTILQHNLIPVCNK